MCARSIYAYISRLATQSHSQGSSYCLAQSKNCNIMNDHSTWGVNHSILLNHKEGAGMTAFKAVDALAKGIVGTIAFSAFDATTKAHT